MYIYIYSNYERWRCLHEIRRLLANIVKYKYAGTIYIREIHLYIKKKNMELFNITKNNLRNKSHQLKTKCATGDSKSSKPL